MSYLARIIIIIIIWNYRLYQRSYKLFQELFLNI